MGNSFKLAWGGWFYGIAGGFIGGGANAIVTGFSAAIDNPQHADFTHLFRLMGIAFIFGGAISTAFFLQKSPLPQVEVEAKETTTTPVEGGGTKTTEIKLSGTLPDKSDKETKS